MMLLTVSCFRYNSRASVLNCVASFKTMFCMDVSEAKNESNLDAEDEEQDDHAKWL